MSNQPQLFTGAGVLWTTEGRFVGGPSHPLQRGSTLYIHHHNGAGRPLVSLWVARLAPGAPGAVELSLRGAVVASFGFRGVENPGAAVAANTLRGADNSLGPTVEMAPGQTVVLFQQRVEPNARIDGLLRLEVAQTSGQGLPRVSMELVAVEASAVNPNAADRGLPAALQVLHRLAPGELASDGPSPTALGRFSSVVDAGRYDLTLRTRTVAAGAPICIPLNHGYPYTAATVERYPRHRAPGTPTVPASSRDLAGNYGLTESIHLPLSNESDGPVRVQGTLAPLNLQQGNTFYGQGAWLAVLRRPGPLLSPLRVGWRQPDDGTVYGAVRSASRSLAGPHHRSARARLSGHGAVCLCHRRVGGQPVARGGHSLLSRSLRRSGGLHQ